MTWLIADLHAGQKNIVKFTHDEKPLRPWDTLEEHDEALVDNWNSTVPVNGKVYVAGDVVFKNKNLPILGRLNGKKILIKGNHDLLKPLPYLEYFSDIRAEKTFTEFGVILTHIPIHPECLTRWKANVHGHLHMNVIGKSNPDPRYLCVSVEQINFRPIHLDVVIERLKERGVL